MIERPVIVTTELDRENHLINLVRVSAAILVVLSHARIMFITDYTQAPHNLPQTMIYGFTALGKQAVIVFFVLSGYWVGGNVLRNLRNNKFDPIIYLSDRWLRLSIVLLPCLALTGFLDGLGHHLFPYSDAYNGSRLYQGVVNSTYGHHSFGTIVGNILFLQGIITDNFGTDSSLWSISYEFWMYLVGAALIYFIVMPMRRSGAIAIILLISAYVVSPILLVFLPTWMIGAAVAMYEPALLRLGARAPKAITIARLGAVVFLLAMSLSARGMSFLPLWAASYMVAIPSAALLCALAARAQTPMEMKLFGWSSKIAASSYSLYAIHVPVLIFLIAALNIQADGRLSSTPIHWLYLAFVVSLLIVCGSVFAMVTERHTGVARKIVRRRLARRRIDR